MNEIHIQPFLFKPLSEDNLELLYYWFQEPTINQSYARSQHWSLDDIKKKYLPRIQSKDDVPSFIIYNNERPIGFIQYYCLTDHFPEGIKDFNHPLFSFHPPNKLVGLDLFISSHKDRGIGLGKQIIEYFITNYLMNFSAVIVDPDSTNTQAIRCYEKVGFELTNYTDNPKHIIMIKRIE